MTTSRRVAIAIFVFLWTISTHGKPSVSGDEPYYLIVAHSLVVDGDLNLTNNFANGDGRFFGAPGIEPSNHVATNSRGALWSAHDVGLSFVVAPAYALGKALEARMPTATLMRFRMTEGRFAYAIVSLFLILLTSIGAGLLHHALTALASSRAATIVTLLIYLCPPVLAHSFLVFPETPMLFVTSLVVWLAYRSSAARFGTLMFGALALGLAPWMHRKFSFFVLGLALALWSARREQIAAFDLRRRVALAAAVLVPHALFHLFTLMSWGALGGPLIAHTSTPQFHVSAIPEGAIGMMFDRSRGLIPYAPIFVLLPAAWWVAGRRFAIWLLPVAALFVPLAAYVAWDAGYSPAARFLVPLMPLVALPAAASLRQRWLVLASIPLLALQLFIIGYGWNKPRSLWPGEIGDNRVLNAVPLIGSRLNSLFPVLSQGAWLGLSKLP